MNTSETRTEQSLTPKGHAPDSEDIDLWQLDRFP